MFKFSVYITCLKQSCVFLLLHSKKLYLLKSDSLFQVGVASQLLCWTGQFLGHGLFEVINFLCCLEIIAYDSPLYKPN